MSAADRALEVFRAYEKGAVTPVTNVTGAKKIGNSRNLPIVTAAMAFVTGSIKPVTNSRSLIELEIPNPVTAVTAVTSGKTISPSDLTIVAGAALARLRPGDPPCDIPHTRWARFIDDSGRFLASGWVDRAVALGWTALDLFGCDRIKPYARIDRMGLLWLLHGQDLLALSADAAAISTPAGGSLTFRKISHHLPGRVLAWQLLSPDDAHSE
jgi:hypothetical protein